MYLVFCGLSLNRVLRVLNLKTVKDSKLASVELGYGLGLGLGLGVPIGFRGGFMAYRWV